jgi:flagellar biosynthesis protein FlhG
MIDQAENLRKMVEQHQQRGNTEKKTRILTVSSGKGGVGKTNLSINLAIAYSMLGKNVVVLDADLGLANVNVILGIIPEYNLFHLIKKQKKMKDILINTGYGINIIAGASGFSKIANLEDEERDSFIEEINQLSFADVIIIDTSAGVSNNVLAFIAAADDAIIITTPEPTAITDAYGIIKIIATEFDNPDMNIKLIVNRVKSVTEGKKVAQRVIGIAGQFLNIKVDYLGYVYDDVVVQNSVIRQKPFVVTEPKSKAAICVKHIVSRLENIEYREGGGLTRFLKKFTRNIE